jgi:hypothetical protein
MSRESHWLSSFILSAVTVRIDLQQLSYARGLLSIKDGSAE